MCLECFRGKRIVVVFFHSAFMRSPLPPPLLLLLLLSAAVCSVQAIQFLQPRYSGKNDVVTHGEKIIAPIRIFTADIAKLKEVDRQARLDCRVEVVDQQGIRRSLADQRFNARQLSQQLTDQGGRQLNINLEFSLPPGHDGIAVQVAVYLDIRPNSISRNVFGRFSEHQRNLLARSQPIQLASRLISVDGDSSSAADENLLLLLPELPALTNDRVGWQTGHEPFNHRLPAANDERVQLKGRFRDKLTVSWSVGKDFTHPPGVAKGEWQGRLLIIVRRHRSRYFGENNQDSVLGWQWASVSDGMARISLTNQREIFSDIGGLLFVEYLYALPRYAPDSFIMIPLDISGTFRLALAEDSQFQTGLTTLASQAAGSLPDSTLALPVHSPYHPHEKAPLGKYPFQYFYQDFLFKPFHRLPESMVSKGQIQYQLSFKFSTIGLITRSLIHKRSLELLVFQWRHETSSWIPVTAALTPLSKSKRHDGWHKIILNADFPTITSTTASTLSRIPSGVYSFKLHELVAVRGLKPLGQKRKLLFEIGPLLVD